MISNIFPVRIFKTSLNLDNEVKQKMLDYVYAIFKNQRQNHILEKEDATSTFVVDNTLFKHDEFKPLCDAVIKHTDEYYQHLRLDTRYKPAFDTMWSNRHGYGGYTDLHNHHSHPVVGVYYLQLPPQGGDLWFLNPLEYTLGGERWDPNGKDYEYWWPAEAQQGDLVLFPGWIKHKTDINYDRTTERVVISFNMTYEERPMVTYAD